MQSVGTRLKEAREKKGFSLDEINARTRINYKNLAAIEHDEVRNIISPFFYRSFVRQYAEEVGLDFRVLASGVEMLAGNMRQPDLPGQGEHQPVRVAPLKARPKRDFSWVWPTVILLGVVVFGSGGFAGWKHYRPLMKSAAITPPAVPKLSTQPVQTFKADALSEAKPSLDKPTLAPDKIHLELSATERTWLTVSADGKPAYTGILQPAETKVLDGQETAKLRTGNAGGVNINFNGKDLGAIGPRGKTRIVVFTKTGYEVQSSDRSTPVPANHIGG